MGAAARATRRRVVDHVGTLTERVEILVGTVNRLQDRMIEVTGIAHRAEAAGEGAAKTLTERLDGQGLMIEDLERQVAAAEAKAKDTDARLTVADAKADVIHASLKDLQSFVHDPLVAGVTGTNDRVLEFIGLPFRRRVLWLLTGRL
ncbi:MAG: hypothetical protein AB7G23_02995 [Vicinamibacterales bacterium]